MAEEAKVKLPIGEVVNWETIVADNFVAVVAVDKKKNIYFSKEWRIAWGKELIELPAGRYEGKTEKDVLKQARNELREEVGLDARKWEKILSCPFSSRDRRKINIFLATDLFESKKERDPAEIIEVVKMPFKKAYKLLSSGKILTNSYTVLGMALAKEKLRL